MVVVVVAGAGVAAAGHTLLQIVVVQHVTQKSWLERRSCIFARLCIEAHVCNCRTRFAHAEDNTCFSFSVICYPFIHTHIEKLNSRLYDYKMS